MEYAEVNAQVLQDVIWRVECAFQGFFRRLKASEDPGYPRFQGCNRYNSFTDPQYGGDVVLDGSVLSLSKIGHISIRLHRPLQGTAKTVTISKESDGWYACISYAEGPIQPLPLTGNETGIDVGLKVLLITAQGELVENPHHYRKAEKRLAKAQRRVSRRKKGSKRSPKAVAQLKRKQQKVRRQRQDFHHQTALYLLRTYGTIYLEDLRVAIMVRNRPLPNASAMRAGQRFGPSLKPKQQTLGIKSSPCHPRVPARIAGAVGSACRNASRCVSLSVPPAGWSWIVTSTRPATATGPGRPAGSRKAACGAEPRSPFPFGMGSRSPHSLFLDAPVRRDVLRQSVPGRRSLFRDGPLKRLSTVETCRVGRPRHVYHRVAWDVSV